MFLLRKPNLEWLPVVMSGVRMGERALQLGVDDPSLVAAIAAKVGLSGHAAVVVDEERRAQKARAAAGKAGALIDVQIAPFDQLPYSDASFDVVVVHAGGTPALIEPSGSHALRQALRVLRDGGRVVVIQGGTRGILARRRIGDADAAGLTDALSAAGFKAVRVLGNREGYRFSEGLKPSR